MKTRLLIPGASLMQLTKDEKPTISYVSSDWVVYRPHVVLWADEIVMADRDFKVAHHYYKDDIHKDALRILLDKLKKKKILKTFDPSSVAPHFLDKVIKRQVHKDQTRWKVEKPIDPKTGKVDMANIRIGGLDICPYRLQGIYSSLAFTRLLDAQCLFDRLEYEVCRRRFSEVSKTRTTIQKNPFQSAFDIIAPKIHLLGDYVIFSKQCTDCSNKERCATKCIEQTEDRISTVLDFRQRDEMEELKRVISESIEKVKGKEINDKSQEQKALKIEIQERTDQCKRRLLRTFPRVERWARLITAISVPLAFAGTATGNGLVSLVGYGMGGLSISTTKLVEYLQSKYRWVAFLEELGGRTPI